MGTRIQKFNKSTIQSHKITLDKKICEFNLRQGLLSFDPKKANFYRPSEGLIMSDFDDFMP